MCKLYVSIYHLIYRPTLPPWTILENRSDELVLFDRSFLSKEWCPSTSWRVPGGARGGPKWSLGGSGEGLEDDRNL